VVGVMLTDVKRNSSVACKLMAVLSFPLSLCASFPFAYKALDWVVLYLCIENPPCQQTHLNVRASLCGVLP
jgi:hypothetical protein